MEVRFPNKKSTYDECIYSAKSPLPFLFCHLFSILNVPTAMAISRNYCQIQIVPSDNAGAIEEGQLNCSNYFIRINMVHYFSCRVYWMGWTNAVVSFAFFAGMYSKFPTF